MIQLFKKSKETLEKEKAEKVLEERKLEKIIISIEAFKGALSEESILGLREPLSDLFDAYFWAQLNKRGLSATKRWCQDVSKKLQELDKKIRREYGEAFKEYVEHKHGNDAVGYRKALEKDLKNRELPEEKKNILKEKNIKEFKKIFYNNETLGNKLFKFPVKVTLSQRAVINKVRNRLNELCKEDNFESEKIKKSKNKKNKRRYTI